MSSFTKLIARKVVFPTFYYTNIASFLSKSAPYRRMILYYHGVSNVPAQRYSGRPFSSAIFEKHLQYISKNFSVVPLTDMFNNYREGIVPKRPTIAITFDDGYENNYNVAYPLLKKYGVPATFFVSAFSFDHPDAALWNDLIHFAYQAATNDIITDHYRFKKDYKHDFYDSEKSLSIQMFIKNLKFNERNDFLEKIKQEFNLDEVLKNTDPSEWRLMNKEQVKELSGSGLIEIGSHGYSHVNLANIEEDFAEKEIIESKNLIEETIARPVISFSFPDGNYNEKIKEICIRAGYQNLVAVTYNNSEDINDKSILIRYGVSPTTTYYSNIFYIHKSFRSKGF